MGKPTATPGTRDAVRNALQALLDQLEIPVSVTVRRKNGQLVARFALPAPAGPEVSPGYGASCREALLAVLASAKSRLTTMQLVTALEETGTLTSQKTVERCLSHLLREGLVNNSQRDRPPGWALVR